MSRKINGHPVPFPKPDASLDTPRHPIMFTVVKLETNNTNDKPIDSDEQQQDTPEV